MGGWTGRVPVIALVGTPTNAGKTETRANAIHGFVHGGLPVFAAMIRSVQEQGLPAHFALRELTRSSHSLSKSMHPGEMAAGCSSI